ncbi:hypothetical protein [Lysobacter gummosus]|uniref:hypothetical protein n=1 Tax=Lysobacter gummosus TaxID=262324 RepID=UPI003628A044
MTAGCLTLASAAATATSGRLPSRHRENPYRPAGKPAVGWSNPDHRRKIGATRCRVRNKSAPDEVLGSARFASAQAGVATARNRQGPGHRVQFRP